MPEFYPACKLGDIEEGEGCAVQVGGKTVALFCTNGQHHAIDDMCPHMGASLAGGHLENGIVTCPWHGWRFRVTDGTWADNPRIKIGSYPVRVEGDVILVGIEPAESEKRP